MEQNIYYRKVSVKERLPELKPERQDNYFHTIHPDNSIDVLECTKDGFVHDGKFIETIYWLEPTPLDEGYKVKEVKGKDLKVGDEVWWAANN